MAESGTQPEETFVEIFARQFGFDRAQCLTPEFPFIDIEGGTRYIDYALRAGTVSFAFEIDGLQWHHPGALSIPDYEDGLLRQNSLAHQGWRVLRWTDRQIAQEPERVRDQLTLFLEGCHGFSGMEDFLPKQSGRTIQLREYQEDALTELQRLREEGGTIALLVHPTGSGKTTTAIMDAKRVGGKTLFLAHRDGLVRQAQREFRKLWPERRCGLFLGGDKDDSAPIVAASVQAVVQNLNRFRSDEFAYIVVDEAHHASASSYRELLGYFRPAFVLGITATPERADGTDLLEVFRDCAHRLSLEEAIRAGHLVPIRCVRVETNVDLSKVRYNAVNYGRRDLEESVRVPGRDQLVVDTYIENVPSRRAVAFCVNVAHAEDLAKRFRDAGVAAVDVSGRMPAVTREKILASFAAGDLRVLCACDVLNEGWDCPELEVLLMTRPTLSRLLYMQQLGRGTRKAEGKKELLVFDFVDNATCYSAPQSLHRILRRPTYVPGALVVAPDDQMQDEGELLAGGGKPLPELSLGLWVKALREIDVFNWQEARSGMMSVSEIEFELGVGSGRVRRAMERGEVIPNHLVRIGDHEQAFFAKDRLDEIREFLGVPKVTRENVRDLFLEFVAKMDMSSSYKPVFLRCFMEVCDASGRAKVGDVADAFRVFYEKRAKNGHLVEKPGAVMAAISKIDQIRVVETMLKMPFEKFERRRFMRYAKDLAYIEFAPHLWKALSADHRAQALDLADRGIESYYRRLEPC